MPTPDSRHILERATELIEAWCIDFGAIKSPHQAYQEQVAAAGVNIDEVFNSLSTCTKPSIQLALQKQLTEYYDRLRELQLNHDRTIGQQQERYKEILDAAMKQLCDKLNTVIEPCKTLKPFPKVANPQSNQGQIISSSDSPERRNPVFNADTQTDLEQSVIYVCVHDEAQCLDSVPSRRKRRHTSGVQTRGRPDKMMKKQTLENQGWPDKVRPCDNGRKRQRKSAVEGVKPVCGQVCLVFRKKLKQWLAALVLPDNFNEAGVATTIASLDLTKEVAECWEHMRETDGVRWRQGHNETEPVVAERQVAIVYFEGPKFPEKCRTDWVSIEELHKYDPGLHSSLIPHSKTVHKFLTGKLGAQSGTKAKRVKLGVTNEAGTQKQRTSYGSTTACETISQDDCPVKGKLEDFADVGESQITPAPCPHTDVPAMNLQKKDWLNSESGKRDSPNGRIVGSHKDIGVIQAGMDDLIQPNAIPRSGLLATADGCWAASRPSQQQMAGHALVAMSSTSGPLPSMQPLLSPVPTLRSARVARSGHVMGRATGREAITESVKLPGVLQMLHGDAPVSLSSGWRQNPTLNTRPLQPQRLLSGPDSSIPSLSETGLRWALTPPVTSPETNHLPPNSRRTQQ
ncbi:hypothetical protein FOXG_15016 [Fusarium oxysporum f. sp. lycopersici 4287]|uniref:Uncharacterized protein n=1 Tax=Fusarium oxysporum f. sp. lycopersici (strain 4287 / CBS 123668 / FGSC 9935 / NRRL 34936) TaxID=426428 RepID=A0A0J9W3Q7_FUSO4|nr:hypothetical protein FOXG_14464 [Fusarium oxysporum f. sp. lycopersici 4287]XP_018255531.1 hypothetical protein FOXG_15016 [Fusarium oxysporum f. sp. lycopersici 4287]KAJ9413388.1 hypothetical protein QL093DRAFT_2517809 [Fusarium oxysporum]KNB16652.1 hypothetical protein FOXG_14464 [Fusarium oxysporum f. sp. lycopersici 4287]KNB17486.1 hypothetical protein FOXG_15016 [Fusarium oxysporum f. sp. lycopersici 4287]